jgi:hypothetical protein
MAELSRSPPSAGQGTRRRRRGAEGRARQRAERRRARVGAKGGGFATPRGRHAGAATATQGMRAGRVDQWVSGSVGQWVSGWWDG